MKKLLLVLLLSFGLPQTDIVVSGIMHTADGGMAIQLVNKTGGASIKGTVGHPYHATAVDLAFDLIPDDEPDNIGIVYETGVADGDLCWIVVKGLAKIYFEGAVARGQFVRSQVAADGGTVGYAVSEATPTAPFTTDKHFQELGHILETTGGAGLSTCLLHAN